MFDTCVQALSESHKEQRRQFCEWFRGRVISRGTDRAWPAHSQDLNPLDFHFWSAAQRQVYRSKPDNIDGLVQVVRDFAATYDQTTIKKVSANVLKRARLCLRADGGHFIYLVLFKLALKFLWGKIGGKYKHF